MSKARWTEGDMLRLSEMCARGLPDGEIAKALGRSENAVHVRLSRHIKLKANGARPLSARAVARMMGIGCSKTITRWANAGWLRAHRRLRAGPNRRTSVLYGDLVAFVANPEHWHRWRLERIADARLRRYAEAARSVRYLTPGEVAARFSVGHAAVNDWIHRGLLPARRWGNWWIAEPDLAAFTPPCERERRGYHVRRFTALEDAQLVMMRAQGATLQQIAAATNRQIGSVAGRLVRLEERQRAQAVAV